MPRVIRAMTRLPGPASRAAVSENRLYVTYALYAPGHFVVQADIAQ